MSTINTTSNSDFTKNANVLWVKELQSLMETARGSGLYKVGVWPKGTGDVREYTEIDVEEYAKNKAQDAPASRARIQQGYTKTASLVRRGLTIDISWEMRNRGRPMEVINKLTSLARHVPNRRDLDLTHRLTFGDSTSYTDQDGISVDISVGDGLALFSTAHTLKGSSTTYRNILANNPAFSQNALIGMEQLVAEQTYNQFGQKKTLPFDIIWYGDDPNTVNAIDIVIGSTSDPSAPNSGVLNVNNRKYRKVMLPRLATDASGAPDTTDAKKKRWGIASSLMSSAFLDIEVENELITAKPGSNSENPSTDAWEYNCRGSYSIVIVSGSWIKMSKGDGSE